MLASLLLALAIASPPADTAHLVIVSTTDIHGRATAWDYTADRPFAGGLVRVATVVDSLRREYPGRVVVVDAGDLIQGDPFAAYFASQAPRPLNPIVQAMNLIGYDAATLGNHEFNWGLPTLRRALAGARFPWVSGNIFGLPRDTLIHRPFVILTRDGVRVGIAGFTTPGVMVWDRENVRGRVRVGRVDPAARRILPELRRASDLAVVLIHSGMAEASSYDTTGVGPENVAASLASLPVRPDLVVVGHSHKEMRDSVLNGVHFVQPRNWAQSVSVVHVDLVRRRGRWAPVGWRFDLVPLAAVIPSARLDSALAPDEAAVKEWVAQPLGRALAAMPESLARAGPTPLLGFIQAMQMERTGAQLSAASAFNLRAGFPAGSITLADVAGVYPYENTLRAVRISGDRLKAFLKQAARYYHVDSAGRVTINDSIPGYNFDMVAGVSYAMDLSRPVGDRIRDLRYHGRAVTPTDTFTMAVNSYRQAGGGGYDMLKGAPVVYDRGENIRDLLVSAVRRLGTIVPERYADSNWTIVPAAAAAQVRALQFPAPARRAAFAPEPGDSILLRILTTNDLHGALLPQTYSWSRGRVVGGMPAIKAVFDSAAADCACPTIRVDAGDQMQGTLISNLAAGRSTVAAFNELGLDVAAVGNHDFDWSVDTLRARMREAHYPWLVANVFDSATHTRPGWARPWAIIPVGPLRIGVVGYITPDTRYIVKAANIRGLAFDSGGAAIRDALDSVRARRPDFTLIVAHAGAVCDTACKGEILALADQLGAGSVDAIIAGHTHRLVNTSEDGIPIVEARSSGTAIGIVDLVRTRDGGRAARRRVETVYDDEVTPDPTMVALLERWNRTADSMGRAVVARLAEPLPNLTLEGQSSLGNLIADAQRAAAGTQVALMNNGGIRGPGLVAGPLTYAQLFQLQPFGNSLVTFALTGRELRSVIEHGLAEGSPRIHVSGLSVTYDPARPPGHRVVNLALADGRAVAADGRYSLAVNDFVAGGGDAFLLLARLRHHATGITDFDALRGWLESAPQPVRGPSDVRIRAVTP